MKRIKKHLEETNWSYWQHLRHSVEIGNKLIHTAFMGYIHGLFPWFWANKGPIAIYKIYKNMRRLPHVRRLIENEDQNQS